MLAERDGETRFKEMDRQELIKTVQDLKDRQERLETVFKESHAKVMEQL